MITSVACNSSGVYDQAEACNTLQDMSAGQNLFYRLFNDKQTCCFAGDSYDGAGASGGLQLLGASSQVAA